jgi:thiol:disulfide interchange protein DsbA
MKTQLSRRSFLQTASAAASTLALPALAQPLSYVEGTHYLALPPTNALAQSQQTSALPLVTEIFWYGCPHCHEFDPQLKAWVQSKNDRIAFQRSPAVWNDATVQHARLFAATIALGIHDAVHAEIFAEIHERKNYLMDQASQVAFLQRHGIEQDAARSVLASFQVDSQVRKAEALARELKVPSIPVMIVRGQYMVNTASGAVRTHLEQLRVVEQFLH